MTVSLYYGEELPQRPIQPTGTLPFRILVLADLGASQPTSKPLIVDRDELDDVIKRLGVNVECPLGDDGPLAATAIESFEDFHPDRLFKRMDLFSALRKRRKRLANAKTFKEELNALRNEEPQAAEETKSAPVDSTPEEGGSLLDQAVDLTQARQAPLAEQVIAGTVDWDDYVRQLVSPYLVEKADPKQAEMLENIDSTIAASMRDVLHHPRFQQLEATWTGIRMLTRRLETGRELQIGVLHLTKEALANDLKSSDDLSKTNLFKQLIEQPEADQSDPWTLVIGDFGFDSSEEDRQTLGRVAKVMAAANATFVSGAKSQIVGCESFGETPDPDDWEAISEDAKSAWSQLRGLPATKHVSLAFPCLLGRRVYGRDTDPIESFAFTELPDGTKHDGYLWINPAYGIATVLGQVYLENGWAISRMMAGELDRLPIHYYEDGGEECVKACGEAFLVDRAAEKLSELGFTVTRSVRNDGAVRFERIKSISSSSPELSGRWK